MKNFNNLEIFINRNYHRNTVEVWLSDKGMDEERNISYDGENLISTVVKFDEFPSQELVPFLKLPANFAELLFKSISDYNSQNGIKTPNQNLLEGKLTATEKHLEDMREFSKKLLDATLTKTT
jgi:hypothetical protein